jgi:hypothetical protein
MVKKTKSKDYIAVWLPRTKSMLKLQREAKKLQVDNNSSWVEFVCQALYEYAKKVGIKFEE